MKCGSNDLNSSPGGSYSAQTAYGMSGEMAGNVLCNKCGYYGLPLSFKNEKQRAEYVKSSKKGGIEAKPSSGSGNSARPASPASNKNPWLAAFMSLVIPGAGQAYCGRLKRGIAAFLGLFVSFLAFIIFENIVFSSFGTPMYAGVFILPLYVLAVAIDA